MSGEVEQDEFLLVLANRKKGIGKKAVPEATPSGVVKKAAGTKSSRRPPFAASRKRKTDAISADDPEEKKEKEKVKSKEKEKEKESEKEKKRKEDRSSSKADSPGGVEKRKDKRRKEEESSTHSADLTENDEDEDDDVENDAESMPAGSAAYTCKAKGKIADSMVKAVPPEFIKTLRGYNEGHLGPAKACVVEILARIDGIEKKMKADKFEWYKKNRQMSVVVGEYLMLQKSLLEQQHVDAEQAIRKELTTLKDEKSNLATENKKLDDAKAAALKERDDAVTAKNQAITEKNDALNAVTLLKQQNEELTWQLKESQDLVTSSSSEINNLKEKVKYWKNKAVDGAEAVEASFYKKAEEAWGMLKTDISFCSFERRLKYVDDVAMAKIRKEEPPAPFESTPEEDSEDSDESENADEKRTTPEEDSGDSDDSESTPEEDSGENSDESEEESSKEDSEEEEENAEGEKNGDNEGHNKDNKAEAADGKDNVPAKGKNEITAGEKTADT